MTGLPKRTGLRSDAEDAAHYRKFHAHALATLERGSPRDGLLKELIAGGVPERTAERIVVSVEQELAAKSYSQGLTRGQRWGMVAFTVLFFSAIAAYVIWQMSRDRALSLKYAAPGLILLVVASGGIAGRILLRPQGSLRNPPPR